MPKKLVTYTDADDQKHEVQMPARWVICNCCDGNGKSSAYLGSFTGEQMRDDPDFAEEYMSGGYDKPCKPCDGSGKVLEIVEEACRTPEQKAALTHLAEEAEYRREAFNERKHESLMLGESTLADWDGVYGD